jgi:hypothetical protein
MEEKMNLLDVIVVPIIFAFLFKIYSLKNFGKNLITREEDGIFIGKLDLASFCKFIISLNKLKEFNILYIDDKLAVFSYTPFFSNGYLFRIKYLNDEIRMICENRFSRMVGTRKKIIERITNLAITELKKTRSKK